MSKDRDAFIKTLKGDPVPKDMFGTVIDIGDYICWGAGGGLASALNFGRVCKINHKTDRTGDKKVTSVTVERVKNSIDWETRKKIKIGKMEQPKEINGFHKSHRKHAVSNYSNAWIMEHPPRTIAELFEDV